MSKRTDAGQFEGEVTNFLIAYTDEIRQGIDELVPDMAKQAVRDLKVGGSFKNRTGKYRKGWKYKIKKGRMGVTAIVYNERYQLTHLLEFGHAKAKGGRTREFPHIRTVEETVVEDIQKRIKELIQR